MKIQKLSKPIQGRGENRSERRKNSFRYVDISPYPLSLLERIKKHGLKARIF